MQSINKKHYFKNSASLTSTTRCLYILVLLNLTSFPGILPANEAVPRVHLSEIISPKLAQSVYHIVEDVEYDGQYYNFYIESNFGVLNVKSMPMLQSRVHEIKILGDAITQFTQQNQKFSDELRGQLTLSANSAIDIITHPLSSASNLAGQVADNLNETLSGVQPGVDNSFSYTVGESADPTFAMHKRNIASQWLLDVYSRNPTVQEFLNAVAKERSAGNISAGTPSLIMRNSITLKVADKNIEAELLYLLKSKSVQELAYINNAIFDELKIREQDRISFRAHPSYTPTYRTRISHYLRTLKRVKNLSAYMRYVLNANDESAALLAEHSLIFLAYYHREIEKLTQLHYDKGILQGITMNNRIIFLSPADLLYWSKENKSLFSELTLNASKSGFSEREIIVSGSVTAAAREHLDKLGMTVRENFGN